MDPKYSNIFWHQGVKLFQDEVLNSKKGLIKVAHLENDVTKSLLNLFEHCGPKVLGVFLSLIGVQQSPRAFSLDFQVNDTESYRLRPKRIMLSIVSSSTTIKSSPNYVVEQSYPDACIYSKDTAILIEVKTQSPLIEEQIQSHIKHYLGSAAQERIISWEDIGERFRAVVKELNGLDQFLVSQFCDFLELIGIAEFNGFSEVDFAMLCSLGKIPTEDFADFKRLFHRKVEKFMGLLSEKVQPVLNFKNCIAYVSKLSTRSSGTFSAFCFYDKDPKIHINYYPNINIIYDEHGLELSLNSEVKASVGRVQNTLKEKPDQIEAALKKLPDTGLMVYYKLQYQPMDHFIWGLIPGFPKKSDTVSVADILVNIQTFENRWKNFKHTILYEMESGIRQHPSKRLYNGKELDFARVKNRKPSYAIRFSQRFSINRIVNSKKSVVELFKKEITKLKPLAELVLS